MRVLEVISSKERCTESGWDAYDLILDEAMADDFIRGLKPLGSFTYLSMLKKPFFKVENEHIFLKGIKGDQFFRLAVHKDYSQHVGEIVEFVNELNIDKKESE